MLFTLGLISMVRKSLKLAWGCMEWSFFSSCISHPGARWTFSNITHLQARNSQDTTTTKQSIHAQKIQKRKKNTHLPDLTAVLMSLSALLKPSAEPVDSVNTQTFTTISPLNTGIIFVCQGYAVIHSLPIEIEVICLFSSAARSLTRPLAS